MRTRVVDMENQSRNGVVDMEKISLEIFGTTDYQSVLDAMAPSDCLVKEFRRRCQLAGLSDHK